MGLLAMVCAGCYGKSPLYGRPRSTYRSRGREVRSVMIPGMFAYAIAHPLMKFLQTQSLIFPMLLNSITILCLHIPLCWLLVFRSSLHNVGAALSVSISDWLNVLVLGLYTRRLARQLVPRSQWKPSKGSMSFLSILILISGLLPNPKLKTSVLSICLNSIALLYTIPYGLGATASTRVSNELGAGNADRARLVVHVVMVLTVTEAVIVSVTLFAIRKILGYAYSNEKEVWRGVWNWRYVEGWSCC